MITMRRTSIKRAASNWIKLNEHNSSVSPFQEYNLSNTIATHYLFFEAARREFPLFFEFYLDEKPIMIAPLAKRISLSGTQYVSFAAAATIAFQDFIYSDEITDDEIKECLKLLLDKCKKIQLENISPQSRIYEVIDHDVPLKEHINITLPLRGGYENYYSSLSKHVKQNIRTAYNRLRTDEHVFSVEKFVGGVFQKIKSMHSWMYMFREEEKDTEQRLLCMNGF